MKRSLIAPLLLMALMNTFGAHMLFACCLMWYSSVPEEVIFAQHQSGFASEFPGALFVGVALIVINAINIVLYQLKYQSLTWLLVFVFVPPVIAFLILQISFWMSLSI